MRGPRARQISISKYLVVGDYALLEHLQDQRHVVHLGRLVQRGVGALDALAALRSDRSDRATYAGAYAGR